MKPLPPGQPVWPPRVGPGDPVPRCECCGQPADGYSADDVPLCSRCGRELEREEARLAELEKEAG